MRRAGSFHQSDENVCSLFAYCHSTLFYRSEHRIASLGSVAIGKAADTDVIRHIEAHSLGSIENAYRRIIIDGEESIRMIFLPQYLWCNHLCLGTVVTDSHPVGVLLQSVLHQCIMITVITVLGDFQIHRRTVEGYLLAARIHQMGNGGKGTHIVIYYHSGAVHARTDSIVEDERHAIVHQLLEMCVLLGILRL